MRGHALVHLREHQHLGHTVEVLQLHEGHHIAGLDRLHLLLGNESAHAHHALIVGHAVVAALGKLRKEAGIDLQRCKLLCVLVQRMAGDVHAGGLALHLEHGLLVEFRQVGHRRRRGFDLGTTHVEQGDLARNHALLLAGRTVHGTLEHV